MVYNLTKRNLHIPHFGDAVVWGGSNNQPLKEMFPGLAAVRESHSFAERLPEKTSHKCSVNSIVSRRCGEAKLGGADGARGITYGH